MAPGHSTPSPLLRGTFVQRRILTYFVIGVLCFAAAPRSTAQTTQWLGVDSSDWRAPSQWSSGVPTEVTRTTISVGSPDRFNLIVPAPYLGDTARVNELSITNTGRLYFAPAPAPGLLIVQGAAFSLNGGQLFLGDGTIVFRSDITINNGGTVDGGSGTLEFQGDVSASSGSVFTAGTSTVILSGAGDQSISGDLEFYDLIVETDGTLSLSGTISVAGSIVVDSGSTLYVASGTTLAYEGEITGGGEVVIDGALPVQMTGLRSRSGPEGVTIQWATSTEAGNAGWSVERRSISNRDGPLSRFTIVGFVEGAGTSTSTKTYQLLDRPAPGRHVYRLTQVDVNGTRHSAGEIEVDVSPPGDFGLHANYPNPFNPSTTVRYSIPVSGWVTLSVVDLLGRRVATLIDGHVVAGTHSTDWNAATLPSGVYFGRLDFENKVDLRKFQLIR